MLGTMNFWLNFFFFEYNWIKKYVTLFLWVPFYIVIMILLVAMNIVSYTTLRARQRKDQNNYRPQNQEYNLNQNSEAAIAETKSQENKTRAAKTLIYITLAYVFCNIGMSVLSISHLTNVENEEHFANYGSMVSLSGVLTFMAFANNGINAVLYTFRTRELKTFYKDKISSLFNWDIFTLWCYVCKQDFSLKIEGNG